MAIGDVVTMPRHKIYKVVEPRKIFCTVGDLISLKLIAK